MARARLVVLLRVEAAALVAFLAGAFFTVVLTALAGAFLAGAAALVAFGTRPAATMSRKLAPARNAGTDVFFTFTGSPVRGLRAVLAARQRFSNTPKPVIDTLSP